MRGWRAGTGRARAAAGIAALALVATSCASDDAAGDPGGEGEDAAGDDGASTDGDEPEDGGEASATAPSLPDDMAETVLRVQSAHGPDAAPSRAFDAWKAAVEEASDGKLTFEMFYGGALAPLTEVEDALASGLVDVATHLPVYNPARFPTETTIQKLNARLEAGPVIGALQGIGAQTEFHRDDVVPTSLVDEGIQPLLLPTMVVPVFHLACADEPVRSLDEAAGIRVRVPSEHIGAEATALGMTPTATTTSELFESLERGIVDCVIGTAHDLRDLGLLEIVGHWTIDPEVMFSGISSFHLSVASATWESLPVEAQQLLWDTAGQVFLPTIVEGLLADTADSLSQAVDQGIEFHEWDEELRATLAEHQDEVVASAAGDVENGEAFIERFEELHEGWLATLGELGYDVEGEPTFREFAEDYQDGAIDLDPFVDALEEVRAQWRPGT